MDLVRIWHFFVFGDEALDTGVGGGCGSRDSGQWAVTSGQRLRGQGTGGRGSFLHSCVECALGGRNYAQTAGDRAQIQH